MGTYNRKTAEVIIGSRIGEFDVVDDGVRPKMVNIENMEFDSLINWTPLCELDAEDAPDPMSTPALRFPFTANQLAAFMLHGCGYFVREQFGDWADGPDPQAMAKLGTQATKAKQALKQAFAAYRAAEQVVGAYDIGYAERIQELESQYGHWPDDQDARLRIKQAHLDADDYEADRLNKMVNQLLAVELIPVPDGIGCAVSATNKVKNDVSVNAGEQQSSEANTPERLELVPAIAPASDGPAPSTASNGPKFSMTKAGLIDAHEHEWPTIRGDIAGAANNGLKAAKAGVREWYEDIAMEWARAKGRLTANRESSSSLNGAMNRMASLPKHGHTH